MPFSPGRRLGARARATAALAVLTERAMQRANDPRNGARPGQLVDGIGVQNVCSDLRDLHCMAAVSQRILQDLADLELPVQPKKMDFVAAAVSLR